MKKEDFKIHIIGAGISGLVAARVLEENGFNPVIIEATDGVGGRVKTDIIDGYQLDHGFQVLLTAYPAAQKYLDFEALELQPFLPGAAIFNNGKQQTIGDPLRAISLLIPTLFSTIGSVSDKFKILKLNALLKQTSLETIFKKPEKTTYAYLVDFGFSTEMIHSFFKPFFSGIFLESKLETSSRMFEFVYKMFGEGVAALPKEGIVAIPNQLKANLKQTTFLFGTKVKTVEEGKIILDDGNELESHYTIIATEASHLINDLSTKETQWKSCETLYFETTFDATQKPLIGLISDEEALINNIFFHTSLQTKSSGDNKLLSVTVVKEHNLSPEELQKQVEKELNMFCGIATLRFIKQFSIPKALPKIDNLRYEMSPMESQLTNSIFLAGDTQLNGSLNAAMLSGELASIAVIKSIMDGV
jgi:protoporphyrinogen oxidase